MKEKKIDIWLEESPNPSTLKFMVNKPLTEGDSFDFTDKEQNPQVPLVHMLFDTGYVKRIFIAPYFIAITKTNERAWQAITGKLQNLILEQLQTHEPILLTPKHKPSNAARNSIETKIVKVLDEYVRPAVERDGGAIRFRSFKDGIVHVALQGACSGCPSAALTLKAGIENLLKSMIEDVKAVEAVEEET